MICWYGLTSHPVPVTLVEQMGNQSSEGVGGVGVGYFSGLKA